MVFSSVKMGSSSANLASIAVGSKCNALTAASGGPSSYAPKHGESHVD